MKINFAGVVELVDTTDLKSVEHLNARAGSIPAPGTISSSKLLTFKQKLSQFKL